MSDQTHFEKVVSYVMSNDKSELTNMTAERDYALHCLEQKRSRIAHHAQARIEALEAALRAIEDVSLDKDHEAATLAITAIARAALAPGLTARDLHQTARQGLALRLGVDGVDVGAGVDQLFTGGGEAATE